MENIISVKDMTFEYVSIDSKFRAIDNLNLEVKQGEFVAIIGHNGTGKSTLSKTIMGYYKYELNSGEIIFDSKVLNDLEVNERAKLGIFLAMQDPISVSGVTNSEFLKLLLKKLLVSMLITLIL